MILSQAKAFISDILLSAGVKGEIRFEYPLCDAPQWIQWNHRYVYASETDGIYRFHPGWIKSLDKKQIRLLVLHEVAHSFYGPEHDEGFYKILNRLGASEERYYKYTSIDGRSTKEVWEDL